MMADQITTVSQLEALYDRPSRNSLVKVAQHITPKYGAWIGTSRFCILSTVGADGTDGSPRGDEDPVAWIQDPQTLLMPDWRGNNRLDSLRNIVKDGRVSLMFMVPGKSNVVRINGQLPRCVMVVSVSEVYGQCARAIIRSGLWDGQAGPDLPSMGDILQAQTAGEAEQSARIDSAAYEKDWRARVTKSLW
jgi:predicted pyridoxine 5'-phosphate oxidase superfamily flavin-nucleotide-binding protein